MQFNLNGRKLFFMLIIVLIMVWTYFFIEHGFGKIVFSEIRYIKFDVLFKVLVTVLSVSIIVLVLWFSDGEKKSAEFRLDPWLYGFCFVLLLGMGLVLIGNPDGRFPWGDAPYYLRVAGRTIKPRMFLKQQIKKPVDIVILGSSRAFTISTQTLSEKWDVTAFNMSVESGSTVDFLALTNFVIDNQDSPPHMLLVEVANPTISNFSWISEPVSLSSYLPLDKSLPIVWDAAKTVVSLTSVTDSIYALTLLENQPPYITFESSGYLAQSTITNEEYKSNLQEMKDVFPRLRCKSLDETGIDYVERLVALAVKNDMSIVFYRSPLNNDFLKKINLNNLAYKTCNNLIQNYFEQLAASHPNVFFQDLVYYEPVVKLRQQGFTDTWHLTTFSADMVVEALSPQIEAGLAWARSEREK